MSVSLLLCALLSLALGLLLVSPYFDPLYSVDGEEGGVTSDSARSLIDTKERLLRSLKDLDQDFAMGKVEDDDYSTSKRALSLELAQILEQISRCE